MLRHVSKMVADFLLKKEVIDPSEVDIYIYGYETLISSLADLGIVIAIGLLSSSMTTMLVFFAMFMSVRLYTGGYHANTFLMCKVIFTGICLGTVYLSKIQFPMLFSVFVLILFVLTSWFLAPVENYNKPLTDEEKRKYHKIGVGISAFWAVLGIAEYFFYIRIYRTITITALFITLMMFIGEYGKEVTENEKGI